MNINLLPPQYKEVRIKLPLKCSKCGREIISIIGEHFICCSCCGEVTCLDCINKIESQEEENDFN